MINYNNKYYLKIQKSYYAPCYLTYENAAYMSCDGHWEKLDDYLVKERFYIAKLQGQRERYLIVSVYTYF